MKIIGICGEIGSGKSTFAELITGIDTEHSLHLETSTIISELGNTFNVSLREHDITQDDDIAVTNTILPTLLPQLATMAERDIGINELGINPADAQLHPQWYEKLFVYLDLIRQQPQLIEDIITPANKDTYRPLLQWIGGYVLYRLDNPLLWYQELMHRVHWEQDVNLVALTAPRQPAEGDFVRQMGGQVIKVVRPILTADTADVTEQNALRIVADITVINNGTLEELAALAGRLHRDITHGMPGAVYIAHE